MQLITITCDNGHEYKLTPNAVEALKNAHNGKSAEAAFEGFAPHVPAADRARVWFSV